MKRTLILASLIALLASPLGLAQTPAPIPFATPSPRPAPPVMAVAELTGAQFTALLNAVPSAPQSLATQIAAAASALGITFLQVRSVTFIPVVTAGAITKMTIRVQYTP